MEIVSLRAFSDNYVYLLANPSSSEIAVVDPGDAAPVLSYLNRTSYRLAAILNTHHHNDHTGGNRVLIERYPGLPVLGGAADRGRIYGQNVFLREGDEVRACGRVGRVLDVPGHTRGHIAYYFASGDGGQDDLFSGDTVFGGTIGNLFEGTPEIMFGSIQKIRQLPAATRIWCSHEYTLQYVREAAGVDPANPRTAERLKKLENSACSGKPTIPLLLDEECATNPFFRWDDPGLAARLNTAPGIDTFLRICDIA